ncbi:hypothetical protein FSP39_008709 [Pinctada imbricata]|uniref:GST N-terminal domain-containing protein n=1 Tax=Pinctada imbricata TaxID=66713 RepID=A0AA88YQG5_PINIB|nr:hypothetical protein FSP39_008709 [Pinctada imbricata]
MPGYKLTYFDLKARVEPTRVLFAAAGIPFDDVRVSNEEFAKMKESKSVALVTESDLFQYEGFKLGILS